MQREAAEDEAPASSVLMRVAGGLTKAASALSILLLVVMLALVTYAVTQRYFVGRPLSWADDLNGYLLIAFAALGAAEALRRNDHIAIDVLASRVGPTGRWLLGLWSDLAVVVFAGVLCWSAYGHARFNHSFGAYSNDQLELALWIPFVPLVIGAGLLAATAFARILERLARRGVA